MAGIVKNIFKVSVVALTIPVMAFGAQRTNPRGAISNRDNTSGSTTDEILETRELVKDGRQSRVATTTSQSIRSRSVSPQVLKVRSARSEPTTNTGKSRVASKSSVARATSVFNDVSKIGGGYSACHDAYATCMDQICANANDTYRRCFCSDRFSGFRDTSENLDNALVMLAQFQDTNLDAVGKTAAEVTAMYTASEGEKKIKKDTSASQKLLNNISNILSGKTSTTQKTSLNSLGVLDFSGFDLSDDDIWGESSSMFGASGSNIADLEGKALYNKAHKQCAEIVQEACGGKEATFNLARNAYSIMISQDCNVVEKSINAKRASIEETVRTAQKYLRDARLDEYRTHNSADVLECLSNVETAMRNPLACGANYERCMDYTGRYIDFATGNPIYSNQLFGLNSLIVLDGSADVLKANSEYDKWLDKKTKKFAETALDSCRDISDVVWREFKRSALIQMAQAQDDKIQQIKDSCVKTIKDCYDEKSDTLYEIDTTELQSTGALVAIAARGTCYDKVLTCAALYGDQDGCKYDDKTKKLTNAPGKKCGLQSLLAFVDTVDSVKVAEGCEVALTKYAHQLCDPKVGDLEDAVYPEGCRYTPRSELLAAMDIRRKTFCPATMVEQDGANTLSTSAESFNIGIMNQIIQDIYRELEIGFTAGCEAVGGRWVAPSTVSWDMLSSDFYYAYYGITVTNQTNVADLNQHGTGWCVGGEDQEQCLALGNYAIWNSTSGCQPTNDWYSHACTDLLGGTWNNNNTCTVPDIFSH